jgi:polyisoprenyl-phosphate glycosyltransferase
MHLSIVIPTYNEELNLNILFQRLYNAVLPMGVDFEFIFVNDGSRDLTMEKIRMLADQHSFVRYVDFSRNFGHQIAVTAGLEHSRGENIAIIDADLQDPPELIPLLYEKTKEGFDVVYAKRRKRRGEKFLKRVTARWFYRALKKMTSIDIPVDTGDFRIINRRILKVLVNMPEHEKFLRGQISWAGFKQTYLEYDRDERAAGTTGYTYGKMIRFALDGITSFSNVPLKLATFAGFTVSGIAFLISLYALYARFVSKDYVPGWTSLILSVLFLGGIQLICLGTIGEYISRISENIRNRPLYVVKDTNCERTVDQ